MNRKPTTNIADTAIPVVSVIVGILFAVRTYAYGVPTYWAFIVAVFASSAIHQGLTHFSNTWRAVADEQPQGSDPR